MLKLLANTVRTNGISNELGIFARPHDSVCQRTQRSLTYCELQGNDKSKGDETCKLHGCG